jgi:hypothetical protein
MQGAKIFSKFDLKMGYNQVRVKPEDCWKTTFMTPEGPWYMNVMMFGFAGAPPYFQHFMSDKVLADLIGNHVENYLDDTATHNETYDDHLATNQSILQRFRENGLYTNAKKCEFHKDQIEFLGVDMFARRI